MSNWKHTAFAVLSVAIVVSMSTMQYRNALFAMKNETVNIEVDEINRYGGHAADGEYSYINASFERPRFAETERLMQMEVLAMVEPEFKEESESAPVAVEETEMNVVAEATAEPVVTVDVEPQVEAEPKPAFEVKKGYISYSGSSVNVRMQPSKNSEVVASLVIGNCFDVTDVTDDDTWYAVKLANGTTGYIMKDLVSFDYNAVKSTMLSTTMYETAKVAVSGGKLNVRNMPSENNSVVLDQVADGALLYIVEKLDGGWLKVIFGSDYDTGYVMAKYVVSGEMIQREEVKNARTKRINAVAKKGTIVTTGNGVNVRTAPSESAEAVATFKNGDNCTIIKQGSKWTKIAHGNGVAYVISSAVFDDAALAEYNKNKETAARKVAETPAKTEEKTPDKENKAVEPVETTTPSNATKGANIIAEAEKYIGTKYVYGGSSPSGFDCSGYVQYVMKKVGIKVNRSSRDQYKNGVAVARENLAAGDLVFFSKGGSISHVGIYAGNGKVLHSPSPGKTVCYTTLEHMCSYSTYVGARRVY